MKKRILAMAMCLSMCFCVACGTNRNNELDGNNSENDHSGLGAYYFVDCTSVQSANGEWSEYQIGAQAIS